MFGSVVVFSTIEAYSVLSRTENTVNTALQVHQVTLLGRSFSVFLVMCFHW